jgi:hypothetical protein
VQGTDLLVYASRIEPALTPDATHIRPILGLSDFAPRFIDWGGPAPCRPA